MIRESRPFLLLAVSSILFVGATVASAGAVGSQGSSLWWTLSDDLSPAELKAALEDPEQNQRRLSAAIGAGLWPAASTESHSIRRFYTGAATPELVPMWAAFHSFAVPLRGMAASRSQAKARFELDRYGLGPESIAAILDAALLLLSEAEQQSLLLREKQLAFVEILQRARQRMAPTKYREALDQRSAERIAAAANESLPRVRSLMKIWERDPVAELTEIALQRLQQKLAPETWERFREFLLLESAPQVTAVEMIPIDELAK